MNPQLLQRLEQLVEGVSLKELSKESERLSSFYRERTAALLPPLSSPTQRLAYLCARLPATYAAIRYVLQQLPTSFISSLLDIGSGPGSALLACIDVHPELKEALLVERDPHFISLAKQLTDYIESVKKEWCCQEALHFEPQKTYDLVTAAYFFNELNPLERVSTAMRLWQITGQYLVFVEPGTPSGFSLLREIRDHLLLAGASLIAPCPHQHSCPLPSNDWCHFSVRLSRSSLQRKVKSAELNYEDEKFFYLIFSRHPLSTAPARIIRRPVKEKGSIRLCLCTAKGIEERKMTKQNGALFKAAKKVEWGDPYPLEKA